ncbi:MAG: CDP-glycerol glycerophosphotransferase family protein [Spirochaetaceae bacterium]|nr:CDP-glycerol glycerophosphotransferase family protein [Spirochaetaceae bacterium]
MARNKLKKLLISVFYIIDVIIPKNKKLFVAGSSHGRSLFGNPKALFHYINTFEKDYQCFFLIKDRKKADVNSNIYYNLSFKGLWIFFRSKYLLMSHGSGDFYLYNGIFSRRKTVIQCWHGVPLKCMGFREIPDIPEKSQKEILLNNKRMDLFLTSSFQEKESIHQCFHIEESKILVTGRACIDTVLSPLKESGFHTDSGMFNILYALTYRPGSESVFFPFSDFDLEELIEFLENNNICIYLRAHVNEVNQIMSLNSDHIRVFPFSDYPDIYDYLSSFQCLITDYSSLYIDFLVLDRPLLFIPYDLEQYKQNPGLLYEDYDSVTPGDKIPDFSSLKKQLLDIRSGIDRNRDKRNKVNNFFNRGIAENSSSRVFSDIIKNEQN